MKRRRITIGTCLALVGLAGGAPAAAQVVNNVATAPPATNPPAPATAPTGNSVGPPQLRDFTLNGTVTRPADSPAVTPAPTPAPGSATTTTRAATSPASAQTRSRGTPAPPPAVRRAPAANDDRPAIPGAPPIAENFPSITPSVSTETPLPQMIEPTVAPVADRSGVPAMWPWLAALLAVGLGGAFLWWRRQQRQSGYATGRAGLGGQVDARDAALPVQPRPAPVPVQPRPVPQPQAEPAPPAQTPPAPIGIVASGLKPRIEFELVPVRAEVDAGQGAAVTVEIDVINRGSAPARDVLVEAQLINAGPNVDQEVGRFFMQPPGNGERVPMIKPMSRITVRLRLAADPAQLAPLIVEGRKLLVPLVAVNAAYRWSGGELRDSSSFLIGRGDADATKLAPFRLDQGARSWSALAARLHSSGLQPA